jgi:hypothetical protein
VTEASSIFVRLSGQDVGLSTLLTQVDQKTQRSADSAARLQAQYARLASVSGNAAQSTAILTNALQNNGGASAGVVTSLATQLATMQRGGSATQQLATATQGLGSTLGQLGGQLSQLGGTAGSLAGSLGGLAGSLGGLGGIGAAIGLGKVALDLGVAGANADLLRTRFDSLAVSAGTTGAALITALRSASGGEISDLNLTLAANKAQLLGVADSAEEFGVLMGIARDRAQQMGISTTQAFNDLTTGLGRGSALILDNLGIIVSVKEANEQYAASLGKTAAALTEAEQKQALINQVLAQGRASLAATGGAVASTSGQFAQLSANLANATSGVGSFLSIGLGQMAGQINATVASTGALVTSIQGIPAALFPTADAANASAAALAAFDAELARSGDVTQAEAAYQAALAASLAQSAAAAAQSTAATAALSGAYDANVAAVLGNTGATTAHTAALAASAQSLVDETTKKIESAAAADRLAQFQQTLASLGPAVAGGLQTAASAAAFLASRYGIATGEALRLIGAQAALAGAAAKVPMVGIVEDRLTRDTPADRAKVKSDQALESNRKLLASINALNNPPKGRSGGGGAAKLSDQAKLNNQLLTQQDAAAGKFEDAEADHYDRLMKIQIDFAKKSLEQQQLNEVSKRQSQADFYDRLTSSDLNKKKGGTEALQRIDADYQAAYQKSQELAQAGNAKLAADYLALKSKQASDELTYQENLAKAAEEKDKAEISRLEAIHKLRADTAAEEEKQLLAGGDANVNAKQDALDQEAARNQEALQKIETASDRATDRQIANATRAGKAIDTTTLAIERQRQAYDRVGGPAAASGTATPASTAAGATTATTAPTDAPTLGDLITALMGRLDAVVSAEKDGASRVVSAVHGLKSSGGIAG